MIWKRERQELMILRPWSTGDHPHILTSRYDSNPGCLSLFWCFQLLKSHSLGLLAVGKLSSRATRNEEHEPAGICCSLKEARYWVYLLHSVTFALIFSGSYSSFFFAFYRKSSGFSRGASMYRGVTRFCFDFVWREKSVPANTLVFVVFLLFVV